MICRCNLRVGSQSHHYLPHRDSNPRVRITRGNRVAVLDFLAGALASRESHFTKPKQQSDGRSSLATQPTWILDDLASCRSANTAKTCCQYSPSGACGQADHSAAAARATAVTQVSSPENNHADIGAHTPKRATDQGNYVRYQTKQGRSLNTRPNICLWF